MNIWTFTPLPPTQSFDSFLRPWSLYSIFCFRALGYLTTMLFGKRAGRRGCQGPAHFAPFGWIELWVVDSCACIMCSAPSVPQALESTTCINSMFCPLLHFARALYEAKGQSPPLLFWLVARQLCFNCCQARHSSKMLVSGLRAGVAQTCRSLPVCWLTCQYNSSSFVPIVHTFAGTHVCRICAQRMRP